MVFCFVLVMCFVYCFFNIVMWVGFVGVMVCIIVGWDLSSFVCVVVGWILCVGIMKRVFLFCLVRW